MDRLKIYQVLFEQQKEFLENYNNLIDREVESEIIKALKTKMPLIIIGVRRCGKSSLLKLLRNKLNLKEKEFLYINFNDERLTQFEIEDFQKIIEYMQEQEYKKDATLFIDEIQETLGWEKWIDRIKEKYTVFITGSNSKLLSSEIATILTGRSITIREYPFSFKEFLNAKKIDAESSHINTTKQSSIRSAFKEYLEFGGFPGYVMTGQKIILSELYENILYKDILSRFNSRQYKGIKEMLQHILSNISKPISTRTLSGISGIKNPGTIKKILDALEMSFLISTIQKFDYSIKKQLQSQRKIYCIDNGLVAMKGFKMSEDNGKLLENIVFIELKRRGKEIYYYNETNECDFVIKEGTKIIEAIQSCYYLDTSNKDREIKGLMQAMEKFSLKEGTIITNEQEETITIEKKKISIIPAWKWIIN